jgi:hypothetical protein
LIDFIFQMHFFKPAFVVEPIAGGRAIALIGVTSDIEYFLGVIGAVLRNSLHAR